jgi:hypothetical protein
MQINSCDPRITGKHMEIGQLPPAALPTWPGVWLPVPKLTNSDRREQPFVDWRFLARDRTLLRSGPAAKHGQRNPEGFAQMLRRRFSHTCLSPHDLAICERVFDQVCADEHLDPLDPDAEILAVMVVAIFRDVHTSERELLEVVRSRRQRLAGTAN